MNYGHFGVREQLFNVGLWQDYFMQQQEKGQLTPCPLVFFFGPFYRIDFPMLSIRTNKIQKFVKKKLLSIFFALLSSNSTGGVNATTGNTCRCLRSYVFNPKSQVCECPDDAHSYITPTKQCVSCSEVQNGTGAATKNECECKDSRFVFYLSLNKCLCLPKYSFVGNSCVLNAQSQVTKEVVCPKNLQWDIFLQKCVCKVGFALKGNICIECKSIANAKGDASDRISCICAEGYAWDSAEYMCK